MLWRVALRLRCWRLERTLWRNFERCLKHSQSTQADLLAKILRRNKDTDFGLRYKFDAITSIDSYRNNVPISRYSDLEGYLAALRDFAARSVIVDPPVHYAITSGTSSNPKYIPITAEMLRDHQNAQSIALVRQLRLVPGLYDGKILAFMSPHEDGKTKLGITTGALSGLLYQRSSRLVASRFAVPSEVFDLEDFTLRQTLIALFSMLQPAVTAITAVNPSTLVRFEQFLVESRRRLAMLLRTGSLKELGDAAVAFEERFISALSLSQRRTDLIAILESDKQPLLGRLFPDVQGITTWLGGNCGYYAKKLPDLFSSAPALLEAGYISSEFRGSIAIDPNSTAGVPTVTENFFEFIKVDDWEQGDRTTKLLHQLEIGKRYYVVVTTKGGLYRYFINDIVQTENSSLATVAIKFVQKGSGVSSITGEKLYEEQVIAAVEQSVRSQGVIIADFILVADLASSCYRLYYEGRSISQSFATHLDMSLTRINIEYAAKRSSGRLNSVEILQVRDGTFEARRRALIDARGREGQYKAPKLLAGREQFFDFDQFAAG